MTKATHAMGGLVIFALLHSAARASAQDWPQWRGPNRDGTVTGFTAPKAWPKALTHKWTVAVGTGVSSPVLVGDKLYAFGRIGGDEVTTCLDAATSKILWQDKFATAAVGGIAKGYGGPRSTPAVAEGKVFTLGVNGTVSCLDAASGKIVWRKGDTGAIPKFNTSTSPLVVDGKCIVFLAALTAFDVASGEVKWKGPSGAPYGSPALLTVDGTKQIVTPTTDFLVGVGLADGKALWQTKVPAASYKTSYATPIIDGQTVIYGSPTSGAGTSFALKIEKKGDGYTPTELWKSTGSYEYNTPVLKDGLLFGLSSDKQYFCMDAKTGKVLWTDKTPRGEAGGVLNAGSVVLAVTGPAAGMGKASEIAAGDSELVAFEPNGTGYKELAKYKLSPGPGLAYPIVAGNRVYLRGNTELTLWTIE